MYEWLQQNEMKFELVTSINLDPDSFSLPRELSSTGFPSSVFRGYEHPRSLVFLGSMLSQLRIDFANRYNVQISDFSLEVAKLGSDLESYSISLVYNFFGVSILGRSVSKSHRLMKSDTPEDSKKATITNELEYFQSRHGIVCIGYPSRHGRPTDLLFRELGASVQEYKYFDKGPKPIGADSNYIWRGKNLDLDSFQRIKDDYRFYMIQGCLFQVWSEYTKYSGRCYPENSAISFFLGRNDIVKRPNVKQS